MARPPVDLHDVDAAVKTLQEMVDGHYFDHSARLQAEELIKVLKQALEDGLTEG